MATRCAELLTFFSLATSVDEDVVSLHRVHVLLTYVHTTPRKRKTLIVQKMPPSQGTNNVRRSRQHITRRQILCISPFGSTSGKGVLPTLRALRFALLAAAFASALEAASEGSVARAACSERTRSSVACACGRAPPVASSPSLSNCAL